MEAKYTPFVRIFGRFRTALMICSNIPRRDIHPRARLDELIPMERRRDIWERLQQQGLPLPDLRLTTIAEGVSILGLVTLPAIFAVLLQTWLGLLLLIPLARIVYVLNRPGAVRFPAGLTTVGDLVVSLTSFPEHKGSGHRWSRKEISLKVRVIIATNLDVPVDRIRPETTWQELESAL